DSASGPSSVQLSSDGSSVFYAGTVFNAKPQEVGPKTYLDKVAIKTGEKTRLYESSNENMYERVTAILDADAGRFVVQREGATSIAQHILVDGGTTRQLTNNEDIAPDLTMAPRQSVLVTRPDG